MLMLNIGTTFGGLTKDAFLVILKMLPIIWIVAMLIESINEPDSISEDLSE